MNRHHVSADELLAIEERIQWMQLCRLGMLAALPVLGFATSAPPATIRMLGVVSAGWMVFAVLASLLARIGRRAAVTTMTLTLLGDGVVSAVGWHQLHDLRGSVGMLIMLYTMAVTLVTTFRTGIKMALWQSLLALLVLDAQAAGLLGALRAFPIRDVVVYLSGLWVAVFATASLAAVNERELRRRRYDQQQLRELALASSEAQEPAEVAAALAGFACADLRARRAAVIVLSSPEFVEQFGAVGLAAVVGTDGRQRLERLPATVRRPTLGSDRVLLRHQLDDDADGWLLAALPSARDVVVITYAIPQASGALVFECQRRWPRSRTRRVERRLIATARQATAQCAAAIARALATAKLAHVARTDGLTGLANRGRFDTLFAERLAGSEPFSVILVDLDHFKSINDTHGHQAGDAVLRGVSDALRLSCRTDDVVARYGGEEFVVLSYGGPHEVGLMAERLRRAMIAADTPVPVTASLGAASWPEEATTGEALIQAADRRLYVAKRSGRNRAVTTEDALLSGEAQRDVLGADLTMEGIHE